MPTALFTPRKRRPLVVPNAISESENNEGKKAEQAAEELLAIAVSLCPFHADNFYHQDMVFFLTEFFKPR